MLPHQGRVETVPGTGEVARFPAETLQLICVGLNQGLPKLSMHLDAATLGGFWC
jgi:hypothetical protein